MAKKEAKDKKDKKTSVLTEIKYTKKNYLFFGAGLVSVVLGFILLAGGSIVLAPILLVIGYIVFFPLGILLK
jgi:hypothetical protein